MTLKKKDSVMRCKVYRSAKNSFVRLLIPQDSDFSRIPPEVWADLGRLSLEREVDLSRNRTALKLGEVLRDIREKGYYVGPFQIDTFIV